MDKIAAWQLALRFGLELASLYALGALVAQRFEGGWRLVAGWGTAAIVATFWVTFAVAGDPSRSGSAPIPVPGPVRLTLELAVFFGGAGALAARAQWPALAVFVAALVVHHAGTTSRIAWLLGR
jgi:hypothetical protein